MISEEERDIRDAIAACHGFGMDEKTLTEAVLRYLRWTNQSSTHDPATVFKLASEYLKNGHRFLR